jgi:RHS repeat-associated protein
LPTQINLGSSDSDAYTFDPNSNRMTKYTFAVNGQSVVGTVTWNAIGTLETLAVTDPFYSGGNQTCNYTHDDVSRIGSANCGSPWAQTFSYDAFGNVSKSGTISFQPTYSYLTNRMTQIGSSTPTYDANGNILTDTAHTYVWDANGRPVTVDGVTLTYDALGRMVEQDKSGVYSEIAYSPTSGKLALMNGQSLTKAFVPLSGGAVAVYNSSGLAYYRHSDWLGSSRFASTPARALYFDGAYAPFGENYAQTGTTDLSFTGMNQDTVANLFDFPAREYNAIHGRWPSPDPAGISSVHMKDPQTWNRYAYVGNRPLSSIDPTGLDKCDDDTTIATCNENGAQSYVSDGGLFGGDVYEPGFVGGGCVGDSCGDGSSNPNGGDDTSDPPDAGGATPPPDLCGSIGACSNDDPPSPVPGAYSCGPDNMCSSTAVFTGPPGQFTFDNGDENFAAAVFTLNSNDDTNILLLSAPSAVPLTAVVAGETAIPATVAAIDLGMANPGTVTAIGNFLINMITPPGPGPVSPSGALGTVAGCIANPNSPDNYCPNGH